MLNNLIEFCFKYAFPFNYIMAAYAWYRIDRARERLHEESRVDREILVAFANEMADYVVEQRRADMTELDRYEADSNGRMISHPNGEYVYYLNALDLQEEVVALKKLLQKASIALSPYAEIADAYEPEEDNEEYSIAWAHDVTVKSLRRSRDVKEEIDGVL